MQELFTVAFWKAQWAVVMSAPWLIVPLLLVAGFIGWTWRWVKSAPASQRKAGAHVRFTPIATELMSRGTPPLRAKTRLTGLSKNYLRSIIVLVAVRLGRTLPGSSGQVVASREAWRQIFRAK